MNSRFVPLAALVVMGAGWGLTQPLTKIAVSTGHKHFGLIFWQLVFSGVILLAMTLLRGRRLPDLRSYFWPFVVIALVGTVIPNSTSYSAAVHLPAGVMSIVISLVPMFALPLALAVGQEQFSIIRMSGVGLGALAMVLLIAPTASLSGEGLGFWVLIAAVGPLMYAIEGIWVAGRRGMGLDPVDLLLGASIVGAAFALPLALATGQFVDLTQTWAAPEYALLGSSAIHALVYALYVWLVGRAGAVFASQVSYLVTGFGIIWAMLLLGEGYSPWVWAAVVALFAGLFLVRPRDPDEARPS